MEFTAERMTLERLPDAMSYLLGEIADIKAILRNRPESERPETPNERISDIREVAEITSLSLSKIYKMTSAGELPCSRYGARRLVFSRKALEEWMEERTRPLGESLDAITLTARKRNNRRA